MQVVLDKWRQPWDPDIREMVDAVYIAPGASTAAKVFTHLVHQALLARLNATVDELPFLTYDHRAEENAFVQIA
jgi:hypothetical protein